MPDLPRGPVDHLPQRSPLFDVAATGQAALLIVVLVWGLNTPVLKWLTAHFDLPLLAGIRMLAGTIFLCLIPRPADFGAKFRAAPWGLLTICAIATIYLHQMLLTQGLQQSSATNSALISALQPLVASIVAFFLLRERMSWRRWTGSIAALLGVATAIVMQPTVLWRGATTGEALIALGLVIYCLGTALSRRLLSFTDALVLSVFTHTLGSFLLLGHALGAAVQRGQWPIMPTSPWAWLLALVSGVLSTGVASLLWNRSLGAVGMSRAMTALYWVPIIGVAASAIFLGESVTIWHLVALLLVLGGTHWASRVGR